MKNNKGFSLVELIVVIAIMAILAAVAVASYAIYVDRAQDAADKNYLDNIVYFSELFAVEHQIPLYEVIVAPKVDGPEDIKLIIGYNKDGSPIYYEGDVSEIYNAVGNGYVEGGLNNGKYEGDFEDIIIPNPGIQSCSHSEYEVVHTEPATCMTDGWEQRECKNEECQAVWTVVTQRATGHTFTDTATVGKYKYQTCDECGRIQIQSTDGSVIVPID